MADTPRQGRDQAAIMFEVFWERDIQDTKWGGPEHDDTHDEIRWMEIIIQRIYKINFWNVTKYRHRLIQTMALCMAAIESYDRKHPGNED